MFYEYIVSLYIFLLDGLRSLYRPVSTERKNKVITLVLDEKEIKTVIVALELLKVEDYSDSALTKDTLLYYLANRL